MPAAFGLPFTLFETATEMRIRRAQRCCNFTEALPGPKPWTLCIQI